MSMKLRSKYKIKWITIDERKYQKVELKQLNEVLLRNPINSFPEKKNLDEKELFRLNELETKGENWNGDEFREILRLRYKKGISLEDFYVVEEQLKYVILQGEDIGIRIPKWFKVLFGDYDLLSRFRFGDIGFKIHEGIVPFPNHKNYYLIPFLGDSQGFCWWYVLINKYSEYCIVYRDLHWKENPLRSEPQEYGEYLICSRTFEEFLIRLSNDTIEKENSSEHSGARPYGR